METTQHGYAPNTKILMGKYWTQSLDKLYKSTKSKFRPYVPSIHLDDWTKFEPQYLCEVDKCFDSHIVEITLDCYKSPIIECSINSHFITSSGHVARAEDLYSGLKLLTVNHSDDNYKIKDNEQIAVKSVNKIVVVDEYSMYNLTNFYGNCMFMISVDIKHCLAICGYNHN